MIDNYDSFTYNLVQYLGELGAEVETLRNDAVTIADIRRALLFHPDRVHLTMPAFRLKWLLSLAVNFQFWVYALATNVSARYLVARWYAPIRSCMARPL